MPSRPHHVRGRGRQGGGQGAALQQKGDRQERQDHRGDVRTQYQDLQPGGQGRKTESARLDGGNGDGLEGRITPLMKRRNDPVVFLRTRARQKHLLSTTATGVLMVQRKGKKGRSKNRNSWRAKEQEQEQEVLSRKDGYAEPDPSHRNGNKFCDQQKVHNLLLSP